MHALICDGEGCTQPGHPPRIAEPIVSLPAGQRSALAKLPNPVREEE